MTRQTRFVVLPDDRRLMLGLDLGEVFEEGQVYEAICILDEIVLRKIGPFALEKNAKEHGSYPNQCSSVTAIIQDGRHLVTPEEFVRIYPNYYDKE